MLAQTSPVIYKIQRHAMAEPEMVHVGKLQVELNNWLDGEELERHQIAETQTVDNTPSETSPEATASPSSQATGSSPNLGFPCNQDADVKSGNKEPSTSTVQPRRGLRPRQPPDRHTPVRGVQPVSG